MYSFQTATEETESSQKKGPWKILRLSLFLVSGHPVLHKHTYFPCFANQIASSFLFQSPIHLTWTGLFFFCLFKNRYTFSATLHLECVSIAPPCSRVLSNLQLICRWAAAEVRCSSCLLQSRPDFRRGDALWGAVGRFNNICLVASLQACRGLILKDTHDHTHALKTFVSNTHTHKMIHKLIKTVISV